MSDEETKDIKPMSIATLDSFLDWLEGNKDMSREDLRTTLMYSFNPPRLEELMYFRSERERYLRREVLDEYLRGGEVDSKELREAVYYLCTYLSEAGDAVAAAHRKEMKRREFKPPFSDKRSRRSRSLSS